VKEFRPSDAARRGGVLKAINLYVQLGVVAAG